MSKPEPARDAYEVLHVRRDAHQKVLKAAYRALAGIYHPDTNGREGHERRMIELNAAYALVRTPEQRAAYDEVTRPAPSAPSAPAAQAASIVPPVHGSPRAGRNRQHGGADRVDFGRYVGWTLADLARHDPDYLLWLSRHSSGIRYRRAIAEQLDATATATATASVQRQRPPKSRWGRTRT